MVRQRRTVKEWLMLSLITMMLLSAFVSLVATVMSANEKVKEVRVSVKVADVKFQKLNNRLNKNLTGKDILAEKDELLAFLKQEHETVVDVQSVERVEDYFNVKVVQSDNEIKTIAYLPNELYENIPNLNEKSKKKTVEFEMKELELESKLDELDKQQEKIDQNVERWNNCNFVLHFFNFVRKVVG